MLLVEGCQTAAPQSDYASQKMILLSEALDFMKAGEFYRARQITQQVLEQEPQDLDAQKLMAEIIDGEIAVQKEVFETKAPEEFTLEEKQDAVKTWMERSDALVVAGEYEQALLAAERVFLYEPDHVGASQLIDRIKKEAREMGRAESLILQQRYKEEIDIRVERYREQAKEWMNNGRFGMARLAVEKILLLAPKDREATRLYEAIKAQQRQQRA